ncbi:MAG: Flp pilus assembly protein CpaB [Thermodesulfobacteriota bacterium]
MQKYRHLIFLGAAVIMALVTSLLIYTWLQKQAKVEKIADLQTQSVVVAAGDLPWGTALKKEMMKTVPLPRGSLPAGYFSSDETLIGRVLDSDLKANEPILESKLAPVGGVGGSMAAIVGPEKRAMAVKVDEVSGIAGFIRPKDRVDVLVTLSGEGEISTPITKTVLQDIPVLATVIEWERKEKEEKPVPIKVITLELSPEEGEKLALAAVQGRLQMALRNPINKEPALTRGATLNQLLASYHPAKKAGDMPRGKAEARKLSPVREVFKIELIKGSNVSTVSF